MKFLLIGLKKRISEENTLKEITTIYIKRKMDYTDLNTYKTQAKYLKKIYDMKINEIDYLKKIKELCKLLKVDENAFDQEDVVKSQKIKS